MLSRLLVALPLALGTLGNPLDIRAPKSDFSIYAYSSSGSAGIGGVPVISINNLAYISSSSPSAISSSAQNVTFAPIDSTGNFTATMQNTTQSLLYVPSTSGPVGFTSSTTNSSHITTGFGFYGNVVYCTIGGQIQTEWYALPVQDGKLWQLSWSSSNSSAIPISLRSIAPSN
ncbi:hypothetical protein BX600DRAFT_514765 [Xylariales sp. PMI_506]|nr:hypothetical protein BX600DRAFT_514765 [Xylariales sp. PMI_506]